MNSNRDVWVLLEAEGDKISRQSAALLEEGKRISQELHGELHALFIGPALEALSREAGTRGAAKLYLHRTEGTSQYDPLFYQGVLLELLKEMRPQLFLALSSSVGADLLPRLAFKLDAPLVTNCAEVEVQEDGEIHFLRPVHQGRLFARVRCTGSGTRMATFLPERLNTAEENAEEAQAAVVPVLALPHQGSAAIKVTGFVKADHRAIDITEAQVIVAVGRGLGAGENLAPVRKLADCIRGSIGGTRPMVDAGVLPYERQIGQTGKRVEPKLIFLLGISGATEFVQGISAAGTTVAVNIDRQSPVFKAADLGIVGDVNEIMPKIVEHIATVTASDKAA